MREYIKLLIIITLSFGIVVGCSSETLKPDSPDNTAWLMKLAIDSEDYVSFNSLFSDGRKGSITKSDFKELHDITIAGAN